jgi:hypothetical protein
MTTAQRLAHLECQLRWLKRLGALADRQGRASV